MFTTDSLARAINIYMVENVAHTMIALGLVFLAIRLFGVRDPATKIRLFLVPVVVPLFSPPLYYLLFPNRQQMGVLPIDEIINIERVAIYLDNNGLLSWLLAGAVAVLVAFLILKGLTSITALLYLPRRCQRLEEGADSRLDISLGKVFAQAGTKRPLVLLSNEPGFHCYAFGLERAYLLLSRDFLHKVSDEQLEAALAHEVAHLKRRDQWLTFFLLTLRHVLFFNPAIHGLSRRSLLESEMACDNFAVSLGQRPVTYAECLLKMWGLQSASPPASSSMRPFVQKDSWLKKRVVKLLEEPQPLAPSYHGWLPQGVAAFLLVTLFFVC